MTKPYLLGILLLVILGISGYYFLARPRSPVKNVSIPKHGDGKYVLYIDQSTITKPKDTSIYKYETRFIISGVSLTNNTNDTLKYISMSCSWWDIYHISDSSLGFLTLGCDKNVPQGVEIPPHQTRDMTFVLDVGKTTDVSGKKFKVGMNMVKYKSPEQVWDDLLFNKLADQHNLLWSNEVSIP
ncbi:hypothetical protein AAFN85_10950 [Mucilaginibacter sp. CAU 1740]|uniref:hypothetical protein n=1 Tax=Mucilaginibacter sp. CAU 1740 TaxID=3140365 RepID=UPI00325AC96A